MNVSWIAVAAVLAVLGAVLVVVLNGCEPEHVASVLATSGVALAVLSLRDR